MPCINYIFLKESLKNIFSFSLSPSNFPKPLLIFFPLFYIYYILFIYIIYFSTSTLSPFLSVYARLCVWLVDSPANNCQDRARKGKQIYKTGWQSPPCPLFHILPLLLILLLSPPPFFLWYFFPPLRPP